MYSRDQVKDRRRLGGFLEPELVSAQMGPPGPLQWQGPTFLVPAGN